MFDIYILTSVNYIITGQKNLHCPLQFPGINCINKKKNVPFSQFTGAWVRILNKIVNKMNNTKSLMIDMKRKDVIKLDTVPLDERYPEETVLPKDGLYRYLYQPGEQHGDQKKTGNRPCLE